MTETVVPDNRIPGGDVNWQAPDLSKQGQQKYIEEDDPSLWRNFSEFGFQKYMVGIGGPCDICMLLHGDWESESRKRALRFFCLGRGGRWG